MSPLPMPKERVFTFDVATEIDRYFDASSVPHGEEPQIIILMGGPACGKTTIRKQRYSTGYVLVDAAEIFLSLSRGEFFPFPEAFEEPMNIIGSLVARRAIAERRHIVTELIGSDYEATKALIDAFLTIGYRPDIQAITCDLAEATRRNASREDDCISSFYAEPYQRRWLLDAAQGPEDSDAGASDRGPDATAGSSIFDYVDPLCIVVSRAEVDRKDLVAPLATLRHLTSSLDMVRQFRERVDISFDGYSDNTEELWEIPAVRNYVFALDEQFPFWLYFLSRHHNGLQCIGLCMLPPFLTDEARIRIHTERMADLMTERWEPALSHLCRSAGVDDSVAHELLLSGMDYFKYGPSQRTEKSEDGSG